MHYYTFNVGDYRRDTAHLSRVEHGIYRDLIDWYYLEEKPIPIETESVSRRLRLDSDADKVALKNVLADFFTLESDGYHHSRIDRDIEHYHSNAIKNRENGKKGGRPKTEKTQSVSSGLPVESESKAKQTLTNNQEPLTNNQEPIFKETTSLVDNPAGSRPAQCPTEKIVGMYHKHLPMCPRVEVMSDTRKKSISARWRQIITDKEIVQTADPKQAALDFFDWYFEHASKSAFLSGRAKDWKADFDFLMNATKFVKVVEGHYHKEKA
jgi:uncharacterized protein YdaU (DUF1376 family)